MTEPADHAAAQHPVELADAGRQRVGRASLDTSRSATAAADDPACARPAGRRRTGDGPNVFHSPQCGQRPTQRSEVVPHTAQT